MTHPTDPHAPAPEFVAALEREIRAELDRASDENQVEARMAPRRALTRRERIAAAVLIAFGLTLGAGGQLALAQAQGAQQRSELERERAVERELLGFHLQVAREARDRAVAAQRSGAGTQLSVIEAELEVRRREIAIARADLELAEIRLTSVAPRDELWAPKVGERDFVKERLTLTAAMQQQRMAELEAQAASARTRAAVGAELWNSANELEVARLQAESELQRTALLLRLRERALAERLPADRVTRLQQEDQIKIEVLRMTRMAELAEQALKLVQQRHGAGAATLLEVKRAELTLLERQSELERLRREAAIRLRPEQ